MLRWAPPGACCRSSSAARCAPTACTCWYWMKLTSCWQVRRSCCLCCLCRRTWSTAGAPSACVPACYRRLNPALPAPNTPTTPLPALPVLPGADSFRKDTLAIASALPQRRQLLALSATYAPSALEQLRRLMGGRQQEVLLSSEDTSLLGVHQCYRMLPGSGGGGGGGHTASRTPAPQRRRQQQQQQQQEQQEQEQQPHSSAEWLEARLAALLQLLSAVSYQQAVVFCKYRAGKCPRGGRGSRVAPARLAFASAACYQSRRRAAFTGTRRPSSC